jgi:secreted trypsin-like serine protease
MKALFGVALVFSVLIVACAPGAYDVVDEGQEDDAAIVGGKRATKYPEAVLVGLSRNGSPVGYCSGSVVAPHWVLTAGHCVAGFDEWTVKAPFAEQQTSSASHAALYDWASHGEAVDPSMHDVGLIELDEPITLDHYPAIAKKRVTFGDAIVNVGRIDDGKLSTTALFVGPSTPALDGAKYGFPFDYASDEWIESGDSGGPVFRGTTHTIVAVNSGGGSGMEVMASTDLVADWITATIGADQAGPKCECE